MDSILTVKNLHLEVPNKVLFDDLSFTIPAHQLTCITGENGAGKTTLMKYLLNSLKRPSSHVQINLTPQEIQYVPQLRNIDDDYPLDVKSFVSLGFKQTLIPWLTKTHRQQLQEILAETNLTKIKQQPLGKASGGEKQRAYLAQALCAAPKLLILDEVTANLDQKSKHELLQLLKELIPKRNLTVIFISHDHELIEKYADYELQLANKHGKLIQKEAK